MNRPLPRATAETAAFWEGCAEGVLRYQICSHCEKVQHIPRARCVHCFKEALTWKPSKGRGRILSFTVVHRAPTPAFRAQAPYALAIVDMDEGFRLMVDVRDGAQRDLKIDQPVTIAFHEIDGVSLPYAEVEA
ncbi:conserved hypothetical protein [Paraburkholderia unamae]|uniref:Zn-ribbon domain-containing OB-fold protein n=1 Tax=Paraburkholderia unamae TaxID=219649 RepID=UPI001CB0B724|nr:OB-fold domain-containing protein [Paraburkholderia unamae]CAG9274781.1 conserved hypothetical protein [Paraburkholderia unamae]